MIRKTADNFAFSPCKHIYICQNLATPQISDFPRPKEGSLVGEFLFQAKFRLVNYLHLTRHGYDVCPFCFTSIPATFHGSGQEGWQEGQERQERWQERRQGDWQIWNCSQAWTDDQWYEMGAMIGVSWWVDVFNCCIFFAFESLQFEPCLNMIIFERKGTSTKKTHVFV